MTRLHRLPSTVHGNWQEQQRRRDAWTKASEEMPMSSGGHGAPITSVCFVTNKDQVRYAFSASLDNLVKVGFLTY